MPLSPCFISNFWFTFLNITISWWTVPTPSLLHRQTGDGMFGQLPNLIRVHKTKLMPDPIAAFPMVPSDSCFRLVGFLRRRNLNSETDFLLHREARELRWKGSLVHYSLLLVYQEWETFGLWAAKGLQNHWFWPCQDTRRWDLKSSHSITG